MNIKLFDHRKREKKKEKCPALLIKFIFFDTDKKKYFLLCKIYIYISMYILSPFFIYYLFFLKNTYRKVDRELKAQKPHLSRLQTRIFQRYHTRIFDVFPTSWCIYIYMPSFPWDTFEKSSYWSDKIDTVPCGILKVVDSTPGDAKVNSLFLFFFIFFSVAYSLLFDSNFSFIIYFFFSLKMYYFWYLKKLFINSTTLSI